MPVLKREPGILPDSIFAMSDLDWVHVRSRRKKALARDLAEYHGLILRERSDTSLVSISFIQQSVAMAIDRDAICLRESIRNA